MEVKLMATPATKPEMVETKCLSGHALDFAVAKAEGHENCWLHDWAMGLQKQYCSDPEAAYPIIAREKISVYASLNEYGSLLHWTGVVETTQSTRVGWIGPTLIVAAMRAFVASRFGCVVDVSAIGNVTAKS